MFTFTSGNGGTQNSVYDVYVNKLKIFSGMRIKNTGWGGNGGFNLNGLKKITPITVENIPAAKINVYRIFWLLIMLMELPEGGRMFWSKFISSHNHRRIQ